MEPERPKRVPPVQNLRPLGEGGMGCLWVCERSFGDGEALQRAVLKRPRSDLDPGVKGELLARFDDERRALARVSHGNVVRLLDAGRDDEGPWLLMEYVDGGDLLGLLDALAAERARDFEEGLSLDALGWVAHEIARGVSAAHGLRDDAGSPSPILHRDLSPQNVLLSRAGEVKLTDFGIAVARDRSSRTATGVVVGNLRFLAPEQLESQPVTTATDVYGLGRLLELLLDVAAPDAPRASIAELRSLAERCTQRAPSQRPESVDAVIDALLTAVPTLCRGRVPLAARVDASSRARAGVQGALASLLAAERDFTPAPVATPAPARSTALANTQPARVEPAPRPPTPAPTSSREVFVERPRRGPVIAVTAITLVAVAALARGLSAPTAAPLASPSPARAEHRPEAPPTPAVAPTPVALPTPAPPSPMEAPAVPAVPSRPVAHVPRHAPSAAPAPALAPPSAPVDEGATATLRVSSIPFSRVTVDDGGAEGVPHEFRLSAGEHRVHARFADGRELSRTVRLAPGETRVLGLTPD